MMTGIFFAMAIPPEFFSCLAYLNIPLGAAFSSRYL